MKRFLLTFVVVLIAVSGVEGQSRIYWADQGPDWIQRAYFDGGDVENLITSGLPSIRHIALDIGGGKIYWCEGGLFKIQRANLDGTGVEDVISSGISLPYGIALDIGNNKIYWSDSTAKKIQRANMDGSSIEDLVTTGIVEPHGVALDVVGSKIYWVDYNTGKIQRANLDGSSVEDLLTTPQWTLDSITLDTVSGKMYWCESQAGLVRRANMDGSSAETLVDTGQAGALGIALDIAEGKMYWGHSSQDRIQRANLDGTSVETIVSGLQTPISLALNFATELSYGFTYQGRLSNNGVVAEGDYDFRFRFYDDGQIGNQLGPDIKVEDLAVVHGVFTAKLNVVSGVFNGDQRWTEIGVREGGLADPNGFTLQQPRQVVSATPYALYAALSGADTDWKIDEDDMYALNKGNVGIGTTNPIGKLHVSGGSITQWTGGGATGWGKMSVFTDTGTLNSTGDFYVEIPHTMYVPWLSDNYIFKVEVFVSLNANSGWPHDNKGSAYSMALIGKDRGAGLAHFDEMMSHANYATVAFGYSSPNTNFLRINVDTNRPSGVLYRVTVKISH
ncbi:MAG: hypothetical protein GY869_28950 [Planctomycetes bacterium]|nr:hypothetical protein [Planctomycetota bacterium]